MDFDVAAWSDESSEQAHTRLYFNSEGFLPLIHAMVFYFFLDRVFLQQNLLQTRCSKKNVVVMHLKYGK